MYSAYSKIISLLCKISSSHYVLVPSSISSQQAHPTSATVKKVHQLLDYAATDPIISNKYTARKMIPKLHSDASNLSEPKVKT